MREKYSVEDGAILALTDLGNGVIVLRPQKPGIDKIASNLSKQWQTSGISLETMRGALREVRTEFDAN